MPRSTDRRDTFSAPSVFAIGASIERNATPEECGQVRACYLVVKSGSVSSLCVSLSPKMAGTKRAGGELHILHLSGSGSPSCGFGWWRPRELPSATKQDSGLGGTARETSVVASLSRHLCGHLLVHTCIRDLYYTLANYS